MYQEDQKIGGPVLYLNLKYECKIWLQYKKLILKSICLYELFSKHFIYS